MAKDATDSKSASLLGVGIAAGVALAGILLLLLNQALNDRVPGWPYNLFLLLAGVLLGCLLALLSVLDPGLLAELAVQVEPALAYLDARGAPIVIKADGLAAGKGVIVATTLAEAEDAVRDMLAGNKFGSAGSQILIEDCLFGEETSILVVVSGRDYVILPTDKSDEGPDLRENGIDAVGYSTRYTGEVENEGVDASDEGDFEETPDAGINLDSAAVDAKDLHSGIHLDNVDSDAAEEEEAGEQRGLQEAHGFHGRR